MLAVETIPSQIPLPPSPPPKHSPLTTPSDDIITTTNIDHTLEDGNTVLRSSDRRQGATSEIQGSPPSLPSATISTTSTPTATSTALTSSSSASATTTMPPRASSSSQSDTDQPRFRLVQSSSSTNIRNLKGILLVRSASTPPSIPTGVPISASTSTATTRTSSSSSNDSSNTPPTPPNCENRNNTSTKDSDSATPIPPIPPIPSNTIMSVTFAPLPQLTPRKRTSTVQLGVAARSQMLRARRGFPLPSDPSSTSAPPNSYSYSTPGQPRSTGSRSIWGGRGGPKFASEMGGMLGGGIPGLEGIRGGYGGPYGYGYQGGVSNVPGEGIQIHYQGGVQRKSYAWAESPDEDEGTAHSGCGPSSGGTGTGTKRPAVAGAGGEEGFVTLGRMVRGGARSLWRSFSVGSKDKERREKATDKKKNKGGKGSEEEEGAKGEEKAKVTVAVKGGKTEPRHVQGEEERQGLEREESVTVRVLAVAESPPKGLLLEKGKGLEPPPSQPQDPSQVQSQAQTSPQPHSEEPHSDSENPQPPSSTTQTSPPSHTDDVDDEDEDGKAQIEQIELEVPVDGVGGVEGVSEEVVRELGVGEYDVVRSLRVDEVDEEQEEAEGDVFDVAEDQEEGDDDREDEGGEKHGAEKREGGEDAGKLEEEQRQDEEEHEEVEVDHEPEPEPEPEEEEKGHVWLSEVDPNALRRRIERAQSEQSLRQSAKNGSTSRNGKGSGGGGGGLVRRFSSLRIGGGGR